MTLLNTANDGYFNVLIVLVRALVAFGPMSRDNLIVLASSDTDTLRLHQTLKRWTDLGLFCENGDTILFADDIVPPSDAKTVVTALPGVLRRIVFRKENNARFWDSSGSLCADLTRGLAWLMAQNIYNNSARHAECQSLEALQLVDPDRRIVQNDVRWRGLLSWGHYLGFLWNTDTPIVDPTAALRQDLPLIFGNNVELTVADLEDRVAVVLPVLDKGCYRRELEDALDPIHWQRPVGPDQLSTSLSRAIWRLVDQGILVLESRADAGDSRILQRAGGHIWRRFTHVRLTGEGA